MEENIIASIENIYASLENIHASARENIYASRPIIEKGYASTVQNIYASYFIASILLFLLSYVINSSFLLYFFFLFFLAISTISLLHLLFPSYSLSIPSSIFSFICSSFVYYILSYTPPSLRTSLSHLPPFWHSFFHPFPPSSIVFFSSIP